MNIKFIVFYDIESFKNEERNSPLSSKNVVDYIVHLMNSNNINVEIVSPAETKSPSGFFKGRKTKVRDGLVVTLGPTLGAKNKYLRMFSVLLTRTWFLLYLLRSVKKDDVIITWHQVPLMMPVSIFRKLTNRKNPFYICVGELYQKVVPEKMSGRKKKIEYDFLNSGDKFILSTRGLENYLSIGNKESLILPGTLNTNKEYERIFNDDKIHIVYSGVINKTKGAKEAIDIMNYLDDKYCMHILGWGATKNDLKNIQEYIRTRNNKAINKVIFEGVLTGENYLQFLSSCDIGICSQDITAEYNDCSFPSKILSYLSCNLRVICSDISAVRQSDVSGIIYFTKTNNAKELSEIIKTINISEYYNSKDKINKLSQEFEKNLFEFLDK